jgi:hypothetical protein
MPQKHLLIELEELVFGEILVVFRGDMLRLGIFPDTAGNPLGKLPFWW